MYCFYMQNVVICLTEEKVLFKILRVSLSPQVNKNGRAIKTRVFASFYRITAGVGKRLKKFQIPSHIKSLFERLF